MEERETRRRKGKRRSVIIALAAAAVLLLGAGGVLYAAYARVLHLPGGLQTHIDLLPEVHAQSGTPEADKQGAAPGEEEFQLVINQSPTMTAGTRMCNIELENPAGNHYDVRLTLSLADSGEELAVSHLLGRNKRLEEIQLNRELAVGEYLVNATLDLYGTGKERIGGISAAVNLRVVEEEVK